MNQLYQAFTLMSAAAPSEATIELLQIPVTRKDTGTTVRLGDFLTSVTASRIASEDGVSAIAVVCWGKEADGDTFYKIILALKGIDIQGGEWNTEGFASEWEAGRFIQWVSAYSLTESTERTHSEISPTFNRDGIQGAIDAWLYHIVRPVAKDDALSFMITAVAKSQEKANQIISNGQKALSTLLS